jgi:hypothetical protein
MGAANAVATAALDERKNDLLVDLFISSSSIKSGRSQGGYFAAKYCRLE